MRGLWLSGVKYDFDGAISKALNSSIMSQFITKEITVVYGGCNIVYYHSILKV